MNDPNTFPKAREAKFQLRPTDNQRDEEKNEAMWRDADTPRALEREQHNVGVMRH
jgi:hypothetical protein